MQQSMRYMLIGIVAAVFIFCAAAVGAAEPKTLSVNDQQAGEQAELIKRIQDQQQMIMEAMKRLEMAKVAPHVNMSRISPAYFDNGIIAMMQSLKVPVTLDNLTIALRAMYAAERVPTGAPGAADISGAHLLGRGPSSSTTVAVTEPVAKDVGHVKQETKVTAVQLTGADAASRL